ncbi:MAG TPA: addiction module protein [Pyrinomonadaceae bacterium]|nr:addiction module protein [Pyrinomonadaceae bacterium]
MPETSIPIPQGFTELTKAEQLRYVQSLWDQISEQPEEIPVPESHPQLVKERLRRYRQNPASAQPAFEVVDRILQKRK